MINFSLLQNPLGNFLRLFLKIIPSETILPIVQGRLRGKLWVKGSGVNSYWLGTYEFNMQKLFAELIKKGDVVYDIGANVGFYTLSASVLGAKVCAFEPLPRNLNYLRKNLILNKCKNVDIFPVALSDHSGIVSFDETKSIMNGRIGNGKLSVVCRTLDELSINPPTIIKIDAEGEELKILEGGINLLTKYKPKIILMAHTIELKNQCIKFLEKVGYKIKECESGKLYAYFE